MVCQAGGGGVLEVPRTASLVSAGQQMESIGLPIAASPKEDYLCQNLKNITMGNQQETKNILHLLGSSTIIRQGFVNKTKYDMIYLSLRDGVNIYILLVV